MLFLLACLDVHRAERLLLALENEDEGWRCVCADTETEVMAALTSGEVQAALIEPVLRGFDGHALLTRLWERPPVISPKLLCPGAPGDQVDAYLPAPSDDSAVLCALTALARSTALPVLTSAVLPRLTPLADALLDELGMKSTLTARAFLPEMIALCAACPSLPLRLTTAVYPAMAHKHGCTPAAIERNLRSAVESVWSTGNLEALEQHFGHTVDPEKGRPTNRAFLAQTGEFVRRAGA